MNTATFTHDEVISLWPDVKTFARDMRISESLARMWIHRRNIPAAHWVRLIESAQDRDIQITYRMLAEAIAA